MTSINVNWWRSWLAGVETLIDILQRARDDLKMTTISNFHSFSISCTSLQKKYTSLTFVQQLTTYHWKWKYVRYLITTTVSSWVLCEAVTLHYTLHDINVFSFILALILDLKSWNVSQQRDFNHLAVQSRLMDHEKSFDGAMINHH